jgi:hypothetical protein
MKGVFPPMTLALTRHTSGLRYIDVGVAAKAYTFLFDTGAGLTVMSPEVAQSAGCTPMGRLARHQLRGERIDLERCAAVGLGIDAISIQAPLVGVTDIGAKLPPGSPPAHGVVALDAFAPRAVTLDLGHDKVILETAQSLAKRTPAATLPLRLARPALGAALEAFIGVSTPQGTLWLLLDSGNLDDVLLTSQAATALGQTVPAPDASGRRRLTAVPLALGGAATSAAVTIDDTLSYDGVLNVAVLQQLVITLDFKEGQAGISIAPVTVASGAPHLKP